jgi:hypothetical protein
MTLTLNRILWLTLSAAAYLTLAYNVPRQQFGSLIGLLTGLFLGYGWELHSLPHPVLFGWKEGIKEPCSRAIKPDRLLFGAAVLFRLLLLFATPQLSDDVYRFIWDGRLLVHGFNPYLYLPSDIIHTDTAVIANLDEILFQQLNSPDYFTVYPPLNQALFGLAAWLSNGSFLWNVVWLRVPIIVSEIGTLWVMIKLLRRLNLNPNLALLYGLNPLIILELTGNLHFEAIMIFFALLAVWWLMKGRTVLSAGVIALAIGTKLLPLILLPIIVRRLGWMKGLAYSALAGLITIAMFAPFASVELIQNVFSSINLYFQKFEFNASVYYVLREIGYWIEGYNTIERVGVWLSIATTGSILWIAFRWRNVSTAAQVLASLTIYFAFATTVHPWYIATPVAASVFTRFRYPILWSALIPLSYFTYRTLPFQENLWLTGIEYTLVGLTAIAEIWAVKYRKPL